MLTSAQQVRLLSPAEARKHYPVRFRARVVFYDPGWQTLFIEDGTAGIFVNSADKPYPIREGQEVQLDAVTAPGDFAPILERPRFQVIGPAGYPHAAETRVADLYSGRFDSQWVSVRCSVRSVTNDWGHAAFDLYSDGRHFPAILPGFREKPMPTHLVGSVVVMNGVCATLFNQRRQLVGIRLFVPNLNQITIVEPAPLDVFNGPVQTAASLLQFEPNAENPKRVHLRGIVTRLSQFRGFFLQDATAGVAVTTDSPAALAVGDELDVAGFPAVGELVPMLENAIVRPTGRSALVPPARIGPHEALGTDFSQPLYDSRLIQIEGRLVQTHRTVDRTILLLHSSNQVFEAELERDPASIRRALIRPGSRLLITGICSVEVDAAKAPRRFRVLLRSPSDIALLAPPPWWSPERVLALSGLLGGFAALASVWIALLKRQVRKQTELIRQNLQQEAASAERFGKIFHATPVSVGITRTRDAVLADVNEGFLRMFGFTRAEVVDHTAAELGIWEHASDRERLVRLLQQGQHVRNQECQFLTKTGERRHGLVAMERIHLDDEECFVFITHDVTERVHLERQLRHAQKMEATGQLAAGVAHEFNNIMTIIQGNASLLLSASNQAPEDQQSLESISVAADRAARLTRQILAFTRKNPVRPEALDLNQTVRAIAKLIHPTLSERIELRLQLAPCALGIQGDAGLIEQVLVNLVVNARDAMPNGGTLILTTDSVAFTAPMAPGYPGRRPGCFARLNLSDTGDGMPEDVQRRIFDPFFTTKEVGRGTGLGLSVASGIIQQHNGWIEVISAPGQGSTFSIYFPTVALNAQMPVALAAETLPPGRGETIVVVEDEVAVRAYVTSTLRRLGYHVREAANGDDALRVCHELPKPDLILTDVVMPGGFSGPALVQRLNEDNFSCPVVFTSAYRGELSVATHGNSFLPKPYTSLLLAQRIRDALDSAHVPVH